MTFPIGLVLDGLVAALLIATISYCFILSKKLERLRDARGELRQVIGDLVGATHQAELAIAGLKATAEETDLQLSEKLAKAKMLIEELSTLARARAGDKPVSQRAGPEFRGLSARRAG